MIIGLSAVITTVFVSMLDMHKYNYIRYNRYCAGYVEIKKRLNKWEKPKLFIQGLLQQGSQPPLVVFWQKLSGRQRNGKALQWQTGGLHRALLGGCWSGDAVSTLPKSRAFLGEWWVYILGFLWMVLNLKLEQRFVKS